MGIITPNFTGAVDEDRTIVKFFAIHSEDLLQTSSRRRGRTSQNQSPNFHRKPVTKIIFFVAAFFFIYIISSLYYFFWSIFVLKILILNFCNLLFELFLSPFFPLINVTFKKNIYIKFFQLPSYIFFPLS